MKTIFVFVATATIAFSPFMALAHGGGASIETTTGEYTLTLEYDTPELAAGHPATFTFELARDADGSAVDFSTVWVRVDDAEGETRFSGTLAVNDLGTATIQYLFSAGGSYAITARFYDIQHETIVEGNFPALAVASARGQGRAGAGGAVLIGFVAGAALGILGSGFFRRGKNGSASPAK